MSETTDGKSGDLNHDPGSFTHNNKADLPGQVPATGRDMQSPDRAPDAGKSFEQTHEARQPVDLVKDYDSFRQQRMSHMPTAQLDMHADLPHAQSVDRAKFHHLQAKEDRHATQGMRTMTEKEYKDPPPKQQPMAQEDFEKARSQPEQTRHVARNHTR
ncbi:hypothetical protein [uncultured Roseobacter sp.]|uniref:hypothetical protein n=1 Tax=uncultured Roseobacter sp. TaxID=114847 RepID=UPI0026039452|nr:hypothetical protein [uncultured Roseobacter sp.]